MSCNRCRCKVCSCIVNEQVKLSVNKIVQNPDEKGIINIKVPIKTSELINDSGFGQGGEGNSKIENIRVNSTLVPIINKVAQIDVPTKVSDLENDSNFATKPYVNKEVEKVFNINTSGILGSIDTTTDTVSLPDGVYRAQIPGTYPNASNIVVKEGYYTLLRKDNGVWKLESEVKMPTLSPTGKVEEGNTESVSGGEVYNKIEVINDLIANFSGQIGSGIIGEAFPATIPISEGFGIYTVSTAGTFVNFKDVNNAPLIVSQSDLDSGLVQLWGNNNIWEKHVTLVDVFTPVFSDNLSDI